MAGLRESFPHERGKGVQLYYEDSGTNTAIDTGIIDVTNVEGVVIHAQVDQITQLQAFGVRDDGTFFFIAQTNIGLGANGLSYIWGGGGSEVIADKHFGGVLPRRIRITCAAVAASNTVLTIHGR